jgi:hypothetical protein
MTVPTTLLAVSNATTELTSEEQELLLSAINLSSTEKAVQAELKDVKVKVPNCSQNALTPQKLAQSLSWVNQASKSSAKLVRSC